MGRAGWIAGLSVSAMMVGGVAVYAQSGPETTTVERVIDGDTVDVRIDGETERVRLLNVDTPETKHPEKELECLGPEATAFLEEQLPVGQEIELEFDEERTDQYERVLAGVYKEGELVNAEIARAGFGVAVSYEPNVRFYDEVSSAQHEAEGKGLGLFDESEDCTVTALMSAAEERVSAVPNELADEVTGIEDQVLVILAAAEAVSAAQASLAVFADFPNAGISKGFTDRSEELKTTLRADAEKLETLESDAEERIDSIKEEERLEEERLEEEREEAERQAEAERAAEREAERQRQTAPPAPQPAPTTQPAPAPKPVQTTSPSPAPEPVQTAPPAPAKTQAPPPPPPAPSKSSGGGAGTPNLGPDQAPPGYLHREAPTSYTGPRCFLPGGNWWKPC